MKKNMLSILMMVLVVIGLAACGTKTEDATNEAPASQTSGAAAEAAEEAAEQLTIAHEYGETTVNKNPKNVVVFDFGALDTLDRLGVEVLGVPKGSQIPSFLAKYEGDEYENIGSLKEPDFEKIYELQPEVILISGRQAELYDELNKIAPTIFVGLDTQNYMESFEKNVRVLGEIFAKTEEVEAELASVKETIAAVAEKASALDEKALIVLSTGGKLSAYGSGSRFGIIHDVLGIKPVDENIEVSTHGMSVSFEYIKEMNPDYLFVIDRDKVVPGGAVENNMLDNELVNSTNAAQNDNIIYLDPNVWYLAGGGLISVEMMVEEIAAAIN